MFLYLPFLPSLNKETMKIMYVKKSVAFDIFNMTISEGISVDVESKAKWYML